MAREITGAVHGGHAAPVTHAIPFDLNAAPVHARGRTDAMAEIIVHAAFLKRADIVPFDTKPLSSAGARFQDFRGGPRHYVMAHRAPLTLRVGGHNLADFAWRQARLREMLIAPQAHQLDERQLLSYNAPSPRLLHLVQQRLPQCVRVSAMFRNSSPGIRHTDFLKRADAPDQPSDAPVNTGVTSRSTGYSARLLRPIKLLTVPASGVGPTLGRDEVRSDRLGLRDRSTDADDHTPGTRPDSTPIRPVPPCRRARSETRRGQAIPPR